MALPATRIGSEPMAVQARYRDNLARHLIGISRDLQSRLLESLSQDRGFEGLRLSFGPLLALVWRRGPPLGEIAGALGISGQAASQLANLIENAGYVERVPNPADRRSKRLELTPRGKQLVADSIRILDAIEREYAGLIGAARYRRFTRAVGGLHRGLGPDLESPPSPVDPFGRADRSAVVLVLITERIQSRLMQATMARGHDGLKMSHGRVLPLIGPEGSRIREIARIQRVSRQAMSATTRDLQSLGYLIREPDPTDGRGALLKLTPRGIALIEDAVTALDDLESDLLRILGRARLADLQKTARQLYSALHLEAEIFGSRRDPEKPAPVEGPIALRRNGRELEELAERLCRSLGHEDTTRLAALLDRRTRRTED
ncbi:MAG TPA: MarR family transcriptional regulator [Deltaproteobacteria bacterium]|nr:MarR family transcriptional regulator [Deltaproteobacteria bacterium]